MALPQVQHRAQRVVNDDGSITAATFASTENGTASFSAGTPFRIRSQLDEVNNKNNNTTPQWQARVRTSSTAAYGAWAALSTGATYLRLAGSTNVATGTQIGTQRLSNAPSGTFAANVFDFCETSTGVAQVWNFTGDQYTEGECCVVWTTAAPEGYQGQVRLWPQTYGTTSVNYRLVTVDALGSTVIPVDTWTRTADIDSALARLGVVRTAQADAAMRASATRVTDTDSVLAGHVHLSADLEAALEALLDAQASADAALQATVELATDLDASLTLGVLTYTRTTLTDAGIAQRTPITTDIDAAAAAVRQAQADLEAALQVARTRTAGLDARINAAGVLTLLTDADAVLQRLVLATAVLDAALAVVRPLTAGVDASITATATAATVQANFDAALRRLLVATLTADAALRGTGTVTFGADARLFDASVISYPTPGRTLSVGGRSSYAPRPRLRLALVDNCKAPAPAASAVTGIGAYDGAFSADFD